MMDPATDPIPPYNPSARRADTSLTSNPLIGHVITILAIWTLAIGGLMAAMALGSLLQALLYGNVPRGT